MKHFLSLAVLFVAAFQSHAQSVKFEKPFIEVKAGRPIFISPVVDGDDIRWEIADGLDDWVQLLPPDIRKNFGNAKIFYADKGTYTVRAWTAKVISGKAKLSDVATVVIVVEGGKPEPPIPRRPCKWLHRRSRGQSSRPRLHPSLK